MTPVQDGRLKPKQMSPVRKAVGSVLGALGAAVSGLSYLGNFASFTDGTSRGLERLVLALVGAGCLAVATGLIGRTWQGGLILGVSLGLVLDAGSSALGFR